MPLVELTAAASADLDSIYDYIRFENHNPTAAEKLIQEIYLKCEQYARQPLMGDIRKDLAEDVRSFPTGSYVVIYKPIKNGVRLLTIVHGSRDIPEITRGLFDKH